jgi:glyceraldehyde 3-phosphate dehydrogenase
MSHKIGINGFGRIGRLVLRAINQRCSGILEVAAINDLFDAPTNAHLLKYDSTYGPYPGTVEAVDGHLMVDGKPITVMAERDPAAIRWKDVGVEIVIEATGKFTDAHKAKAHIASGGARKVIISAPAKNEDITIVLGVNSSKYHPGKHNIVSNASCTTNGLAPVAKVLNDKFGIEKGLLTTVHAYTNSQHLQDMAAKDLRDARAAGQNIVPSETGAAKAVGLVIPELKGKFGGMAFRVPTPTVSVIDFTALLEREASRQEIRDAMQEYADGEMEGILAVTDEPLVSSDLKGTTYSSVFSAPDTLVIGNMVKVVAWYDNEWGYACRTADLAALMASTLYAEDEVLLASKNYYG